MQSAESDVSGKLCFEEKEYPLAVLNLPCVTECYKTYDDVNLVKIGDVGQVLVVGDVSPTEAETGEAANGVTPPMRNARQRIFRKNIEVKPEVVNKIEFQLLEILGVSRLIFLAVLFTECSNFSQVFG